MGCICGSTKTEYGIFICPICHKISGYDKWQKRGDKWIFHKDHAWYGIHDFYFSSAEKCWKETGGSTVEQWNIASWICNICNFRSKTFLDYINTNVRTVKEDLDLEKHKNDFLNDKLLYNKMDNIILNKKANIYESELKKTNEIIKMLNQKIKHMEYEKKNPLDKMIAIQFKSTDNIINTIMPCKSSDIFVRIEEKLYEEYPQYKNCNYIFTVGGNVVKRFRTMEENHIKNSDVILLNVIE